MQAPGESDVIARRSAVAAGRKEQLAERVVNHCVDAQLEDRAQVNGGVAGDRNQPGGPICELVRSNDSRKLDPALNVGARKAVRDTDGAPGKGCGKDRCRRENLENARIAQIAPAREDAQRRNDFGEYTELGETRTQAFRKAGHASNFPAAGD